MNESKSCWTEVTEMMETTDISLGRRVADWFDRTPCRALYELTYYKFAAKMIGRGKKVLDVGCGEGLGTWVLANECGKAVGIDADEESIAVAKGNWTDQRVEFSCDDLLSTDPRPYAAVVCFDVLDRMKKDDADAMVTRVAENLSHDGMAVIGVANAAAPQQYPSPKAPNTYTPERLEETLRQQFHHVFLFAANDELVHTGFLPSANYLIAVCCRKR
jgi:2-polyprenyl-3-methyl-5-hydroxy-6-metoxy-1,4-benzoquinol methylase